MAFHTAMPGFAAATTEMWPSMSNAMAAPLRVFGHRAHRTQSLEPELGQQRRAIRETGTPQAVSADAAKPAVMPDFLRDIHSASFLMPRIAHSTSTIQSTISAMPKGTFAAANPLARRAFFRPIQGRQMSTASQFRPRMIAQPFTNIVKPQISRTLFGASTSRNLLAHMEETANKNPNSATAQNAFYQALLRANMPAIIVERYQTNQFASNAACETAYQKALGSLGQGDGNLQGNQFGAQNNNLNNIQLQAIGQAVAAQTRGANISTSRIGTNTGTGAKDSPLHVVVEETVGGVIFKWVKFIFYFLLFTYISMMVVTMLLETFQSYRKIGGKNDNEAKAEHQNVRFSDVHGCDEAMEELQELVDFLKNPEKFSTLGGKLPKGVLLVGPPGTGKTLIARAVAGEAGVPFFFMSGSEFDEVYVGVGAKRVRDLFTAAKAKSPSIVFIDELDAIGGKRNTRDASYVRQTLNQLLTELDGFEQNSGVIIIAATNFPELLDKALTRPGRFDRNVNVGLPDVRGRVAILRHHMKKIITGKDVSLETLAAGTPGFSGAELENIINQAAVHASKAKATAVTMLDFEWAKDKVMMGAEKKSMVVSQKEKEMTAYHEAGHALQLMFLPNMDPLHKITIMPRGQALGITSHLPEMDKYSQSMNEYESLIALCMGGKAAEELVYGSDMVTSGVSNDLEKATAIAYAMVTRFGMSPELGNVDLASNHNTLSANTKMMIESEVRRVTEEAYDRASKLLQSKRKELDLLAKALVEYETLNREEAFKVIKGEKLEGKSIMPSGPMKIPTSGSGPLGLPEVPAIPGSTPSDGNGGKEPPAGGAIA
ncbi:Tat-binding [Hyphodiscus hymeniophilus]|uniref:Tat-binding n=1 Tax=Hyphodiscus hymeniophilus TaxID=353542 RepID=A0A9P6VSJ9_9HELO|nr:Tat-binding [Hyphodiscus hymeniophilus]